MKTFKYIGHNKNGLNPMFEHGKTYPESFSFGDEYHPVSVVAEHYPEDWEIVEEKPRFFKFVGTKDQSKQYEEPRPKVGKVYDSEHIISCHPVKFWASDVDIKDEWQEVEEKKFRFFEFIGDEEMAREYGIHNITCTIPIVGGIYREDEIIGFKPVLYWVENTEYASKDWKEVEESIDLYKFVGTQDEADEYPSNKPSLGGIYKAGTLVGGSDPDYTPEVWATTAASDEWEKVKRTEFVPVVEEPVITISAESIGAATTESKPLEKEISKARHPFQSVIEGLESFAEALRRASEASRPTSKCYPKGGPELSQTNDPTNPSHYKAGKIECWDAIESATVGKTGFEAYLVGNVIKYLWRYEQKNGLIDIEKAQVYLNKLIKLKQ